MGETSELRHARVRALTARMQIQAAVLRKRRTFTAEDVAYLKAATALRVLRGMYRDRYSAEEVQLLAKARKIALEGGQLPLFRSLMIRRRLHVPSEIPIGKLGQHNCPVCDRRHRAPRARLEQGEIEKAAAAVKTAYEATLMEQAKRADGRSRPRPTRSRPIPGKPL